MGSMNEEDLKCWVTLITRPSYLPGVIILAHTLDLVDSKYPLIVQYTESLGVEAIAALAAESQRKRRITLDPVDLLTPPKGQENTACVAERFQDTFTKLRAFQVYKHGFTKACFLDADMAAFQSPDSIFDDQLPGRDWLGANHACVCNLDKDKWAPAFWTKGNCAYTILSGADQVFGTIPKTSRPTYQLLNGGMFLFYPSNELWQRMSTFFDNSPKLRHYQLPDQDFLADFFRDKWQPLSWRFNALKTMRYLHPALWSDDKVVMVHYIVDKPWERQVSATGVAGHRGRDGETHQWWWNVYRNWLDNQENIDNQVLSAMDKLVNTDEPFTKLVPLPQEPGRIEDVKPFSAT